MAIPHTASARAACLTLLLGLSGCGSDGELLPPTIDLTGYWMLYLTPTGALNENGPSPVFLTQTGAAVDGAAIVGTVSGNTFSLTSAVPGLFTMYVNGALVGNEATGTMLMTGGISATGTFRMVGFTPTGTLTATGTLQSTAVNITTNAAIGSRDYTDPGLTVLDEVEIAAAYGSEHFEIDFSATGMAVGALAVPGTVTATVTYRTDAVTIEIPATGGTVTVTTFDGNGFAGSFSLTFPGNETLTGTFTVSWDIAAYDP
jgi:hypothetical protein